MDTDWNKIETEIWNPEDGDEISGEYLGFQSNVGENNSNLYSVKDDKKKIIAIWGSKVLDGKMQGVQVGQQVKIKFLSRVKISGGRDYKDYEIFTKTKSD